jgi:hypothetical protein
MTQTIIKPTVGRIVWFHPSALIGESGFAAPYPGEPLAAIVAKVWSDTCVNLTVFDANGVAHSRTYVLLLQDGNPTPEGGYFCEWMPYQKGQAAKVDALQAVKDKAEAPPTPVEPDAIEQEIRAKGLTAPRITPADIEANIAEERYFTAGQGVIGAGVPGYMVNAQFDLLTFCVLRLSNGFIVTGESACASPDNFDAEIGRQIARQNAINKVWPLMGYELRSKLAQPVKKCTCGPNDGCSGPCDRDRTF